MLLLVHFNSQGKLQRFKFRAPLSLVQTNKQKPTMSTVRRVTLSGGLSMKARKPKDAWFGLLLAPWITVLSLHQCSSWVLLRASLQSQQELCAVPDKSVYWTTGPHTELTVCSCYGFCFLNHGFTMMALNSWVSCLPRPPWDHAWWCFKRSCCCLSCIRPSFVSTTEASNHWSPAIISKCGVLHMFWRHNWRQEEFQSSGSEAQLEMQQGMSWTKRIFNIKAHRAYRWWNVT